MHSDICGRTNAVRSGVGKGIYIFANGCWSWSKLTFVII
jgi:hypothetical protein